MSRPLQNRVSPDGRFVATQARGTMFGNRGGRIHSDARQMTRKWASKQWICCILDFKNRQREVMGHGYTELFFLDEATAMAAGHRPCFECRRAEALLFSTLWAELRDRAGRARVAEMDKVLHAERRAPFERVKVADLPAGTIFRKDSTFYLVTPKGAQKWDFSGYGPIETKAGKAEAITPRSIRDILAAGYKPQLHPTSILA